jgi:hypothetical protein
MKLTIFVASIVCLLSSSVKAFAPISIRRPTRCDESAASLGMFSGAGEGMTIPGEEDWGPEELKQMEEAARALGMSLDEYKLGIRARVRLQKELDEARLVGGNKDTVAVVRDACNPPKTLEIIITDAGKALGPDKVSAELISAYKAAGEQAKKTRGAAQQNMMQFISEAMKGKS